MIKYVQNDRLSQFRVTRSLDQVLLTKKSQCQCPKSDRIHSAARHRDLLGSFISKQPPQKPNSSSVYPRLLFSPSWSGTRVREHASSSAGSRLLTTRLWLIFSDVSTLQHMVPPTPRLENQPPTIGHSRKVVSFKGKPASKLPMRFAWDKALQMYSHSTGHFHIFLLQLSFFFFPEVNSTAARSARTVPACPAHSAAQHTGVRHSAANAHQRWETQRDQREEGKRRGEVVGQPRCVDGPRLHRYRRDRG